MGCSPLREQEEGDPRSTALKLSSNFLLCVCLFLFCFFGPVLYLFFFCLHFSVKKFKPFSSSTEGCKREIVHHIPHIL